MLLGYKWDCFKCTLTSDGAERLGQFVTSCERGEECVAYFQKIGLKAIDAAATRRSG